MILSPSLFSSGVNGISELMSYACLMVAMFFSPERQGTPNMDCCLILIQSYRGIACKD
jgi:hypothetical protein